MVLRMAYSGSRWKETIFEELICGDLELTTYSALDYVDVPKALNIHIGRFIWSISVKNSVRLCLGMSVMILEQAIRMQTIKICHDFIKGLEVLRLIAYSNPGTGSKPWTISRGHQRCKTW